jgi:hypothetical protein
MTRDLPTRWQSDLRSCGTSGRSEECGSEQVHRRVRRSKKESLEHPTYALLKILTILVLGHRRNFVECLGDGLDVSIKREWYSVLRVFDILIRDGALATFRKLACEASCRSDPAFQWGVCQLGEIAVNPRWDETVREDAIAFLGELYREDAMWGK